MRNKKLEELAQKSLLNLVDKDFEKKLVARQEQVKSEKKNKRIFCRKGILFAIAACFFVVVVVSLFLGILLNRSNSENIPYYASENAAVDIVEIEKLQDAVGCKLESENLVGSTKAFDKESGDILFYSAEWENLEKFISCKIDFIVNDNYFPVRNEVNSTISAGEFLINICHNVEYIESDGIYIHNIYGETCLNGKLVIIHYIEWNLEAKNTALDSFIENTISIE